VSIVEFFPKLLLVSTQTTGNIKRFTIGTKNKKNPPPRSSYYLQ
jgi:hypothetical protein